MRLTKAIVLLALTAVLAGHAGATAAGPFEIRDLIAFDRLSDARVSPDGQSIVFTVSSLDLEANRRRSDLWLVQADGSGLRRLTSDPASDTSAAWSPDGDTIYFLSTRSSSSQVWRLPLRVDRK
jgi:dipeptidyl aminopeptidase/acylaminoacyl peptidase